MMPHTNVNVSAWHEWEENLSAELTEQKRHTAIISTKCVSYEIILIGNDPSKGHESQLIHEKEMKSRKLNERKPFIKMILNRYTNRGCSDNSEQVRRKQTRCDTHHQGTRRESSVLQSYQRRIWHQYIWSSNVWSDIKIINHRRKNRSKTKQEVTPFLQHPTLDARSKESWVWGEQSSSES